jgi:alpha-L-rhamnosidase
MWKRFVLVGAAPVLAGAVLAVSGLAAPIDLRTNSMVSPLGIDTEQPTFAWRSDARTPDWMQTGYELTVSTAAGASEQSEHAAGGGRLVWDSGRVRSAESVDVVAKGLRLEPQTQYVWQVRVWDNKGGAARSVPATFETGLLGQTETAGPGGWKAQWIGRDDPIDRQEVGAMRWVWLAGADALQVPKGTHAEFRYQLHLDGKPRAASLHVLVRGSFTARVNGQVTGTHDEWGAFDREELSGVLHAGENEIVLDVVSHAPEGSATTAPSAVAASIHVTQADGKQERLVTDGAWEARVVGDGAESGPWQKVGIAGPLSAKFGLGTDRTTLIAGPDRVSTDASLMRKEFTVGAAIRTARLTITALGAYQASINGQRVAPETLLAPGWTDFKKRVLYQTYDVTRLVKPGANALGVMLGGGWYSSPMTWSGYRFTPGPELLRAQLVLTLEDGTQQVIGTDASWQTAAAPVTFSEIYGGESFDARLVEQGWNAPGFAASGGAKEWTPAVVGTAPYPAMVLTAQPDLEIRNTIVLHPIGASVVGRSTVFDMGQNMVGNVRLHVRGPRGMVVRLRYAERLNADGSIYTKNLRNADATDTYALAGGGEETWTPAFTFHGFRYVELTYLNGKPASAPGRPASAPGRPASAPGVTRIDGLVENSLPATPTVRLESSSKTLNAMNELGAWGQRGNFVSIPTDCPQRDERLGWMGDAGAFWRTGTYNFDTDAFTRKFMLDVTDAQTEEGAFTDVSPNILGPSPGAPGWGDAGVFLPYAAWLQYDDLTVLREAWPAMERWMAFIAKNNPDWIRNHALGANYGDWLAPDPHTPQTLIGTAYWAMVAREMAEMATALGRPEDAAKYHQQYEQIAAAYRKAFVKPDGSVEGNTQTAYLATLFNDMAPPAQKAEMVDRLVKDIGAHGEHLTTGFLGTPMLLFVLDANRRTDVAFKLLLSDSYPSWGYMVKKGATTWWERWNGDTGDPSMNSYNHYAFGSVMAWVYRRAAGIDTDSTGPGFHHLRIEPHFDASLPKLHVEYDSDYGTVVSDWQGAKRRFTVTIPANTRATVVLPGRKAEEIGSGVHGYTVE